jgi:hypothetical protein
MMIIEFSRR